MDSFLSSKMEGLKFKNGSFTNEDSCQIPERKESLAMEINHPSMKRDRSISHNFVSV